MVVVFLGGRGEVEICVITTNVVTLVSTRSRKQN